MKEMTTTKVRKLLRTDIGDDIRNLYSDFSEDPKVSTLSERHMLEWLDDVKKKGEAFIAVATYPSSEDTSLSDTKIVAAVTITYDVKIIHGLCKVARVEDLVVKKEFRGQGLSKWLMNRMVAEASKAGCYKIILSSKKGTVPLYESLGFKKSEETLESRINH